MAARRLAKRLPVIAVFLLCGFFLRVPAAATLQGLYVGAEAPDFSLKDLNGKTWTFADAKGEKLTMVIFWSTWSSNSEKLLAQAQKLYSDYKDKGLSVVAVNADSQEITPAEESGDKDHERPTLASSIRCCWTGGSRFSMTMGS